MMGKNVVIPVDKMDKRICSLHNESSDDKTYYIVRLFDTFECGACIATDIANYEATYMEKYKDVGFVYIFHTNEEESEKLYRELCTKRIRGIVYLDKDDLFLKKNPFVIRNSLVNSFVIDKIMKIQMVGNPFRNDDMRMLFNKIHKKD